MRCSYKSIDQLKLDLGDASRRHVTRRTEAIAIAQMAIDKNLISRSSDNSDYIRRLQANKGKAHR